MIKTLATICVISNFFVPNAWSMEDKEDLNTWKHRAKEHVKRSDGLKDQYRPLLIKSNRSTWVPNLEFMSHGLQFSAAGMTGSLALKEAAAASSTKVRLVCSIAATVCLSLDNFLIKNLIISYKNAPRKLNDFVEKTVNEYTEKYPFEESEGKNKKILNLLFWDAFRESENERSTGGAQAPWYQRVFK